MARNAGDETASIPALEELYRRRYQRFLRVAIALVGSRELATDAVQEAFARAIRTRFDFRAEASLETWVWRTLTNVCLDERRRRSFERELADSTAHELAEANGHPVDWAELRAAIAALPERQRLVVFLRHFGSTTRRSAMCLGSSAGRSQRRFSPHTHHYER
jgi:RNA polymerase sigma factor (sigma-70 family)